jgi:V/A-type H+-transporting ATPase subunit D
MTSTTPTNRAARLRLRARLDLTAHAVELLRNKEEALRREQTRLRAHSDRTEIDWQQRLAEARTWLLRARALGASSELARLVRPRRPATIEIAWQTSMGVTYPGAVDITPSPPPNLTSTAALVPTADAYRAALEVAAQHAAASAAFRRVATELADTRRRRRALEYRLLPSLESQLHRLDLTLDERDRDTALRTQLAIRHTEAAR